MNTYAYGGTTLPRLQRDTIRRVRSRVKPMVPTLALVPVAVCSEPEPLTVVITGAHVLTGTPAKVADRKPDPRSNDNLLDWLDVKEWAGIWKISYQAARERLILEGHILNDNQMRLYQERKAGSDKRKNDRAKLSKHVQRVNDELQAYREMIKHGASPIEIASFASNR